MVQMEIKYLDRNGIVIALLKEGYIATIQDTLDLIADVSYSGADRLIIPMERLSPDFFSLKTRFAGEMLQKCVNYGMRIAIIGDSSGFSSKSLHDFIRESNRGRHVFFKNTVEEAVSVLAALDS